MSRSPQLTKDRSIQVAVLVLENHQGEILLTQRRKNQHLAGYWEFPGGKIELGETAEQALIRECQEELNHSPLNPSLILNTSFQYPEVLVHLHVFYEKNKQAQVQAAEHQIMRWVTKQQLKNHLLPPANTPIIERISSPDF